MKTKAQKRAEADRLAPERPSWIARNGHYHSEVAQLVSFLVPPGSSVLEIGCGVGDLLAQLAPSRGVGIDLSPGMIEVARGRHADPRLEFRVADAEALEAEEPFDHVVMCDVLGDLTDVWAALRSVRRVTHPRSRIVLTFFNAVWEPALNTAERLGLKMPQDEQNWLGMGDVENLLALSGFEVVTRGRRVLAPVRVPLVTTFLNRYAAHLPGIRHLCLVNYVVARPQPDPRAAADRSVSVIVPCRNERGNIRAAVERIPEMGTHTEIIFVDGNSNDGTVEEIERVIAEQGGKRDIKLIHQVPPGSADGAGHGKMLKLGKGDAVRKGFAAAKGDVLMILDSDLTVAPEDLPKFYEALAAGRGEFVNGTRLVYPLEAEAMRFLNKIANRFFGKLFSWLCGQRMKDTLCGTKVLLRSDYERIAAERAFFGDIDPFGDFDLLFGAAKRNLKIVEVPVRYAGRTYGEIKIRRFSHGLQLLKMSVVAMRKLKMR